MFNIGPSPAMQGQMMPGGSGAADMMQRRRPMMQPGGPQTSSPGGGMMPMPRMPMGGNAQMNSAEPGGMFGHGNLSMGGSEGPGGMGGIMQQIMSRNNNTGVRGPMGGGGGLWQTYANMMQGDGAPQRRNLTY